MKIKKTKVKREKLHRPKIARRIQL